MKNLFINNIKEDIIKKIENKKVIFIYELEPDKNHQTRILIGRIMKSLRWRAGQYGTAKIRYYIREDAVKEDFDNALTDLGIRLLK